MKFMNAELSVTITVRTELHHLESQRFHAERLTNELKRSRGGAQPLDETVLAG